jgi:cell division protein FtsZ
LGLEIRTPVTLVGIGGAGARLASQARARLGARCILISSDKNDLNEHESIFIDVKPLLNPTIGSIRGKVLESRDSIMNALKDSSTVIIITGLAGNNGAAIAPMIAKIAKGMGKSVVSFAIMPFKFESSKIFGAGVSLRRVKESSDCLVIVDNDALLFNNPDLTVQECYNIANDALLEVIGSLADGFSLEDVNVLCTGRNTSDAESALKDSIRMLYSDVDPDKVKRAMLYVIGGDRVPVGVINSLVNSVHRILGENGTEVNLSLTSRRGVKVLLMVSVLENTKFDAYDPLNMLDSVDWDEIECGVNVESSIPRMD